MELNRAVAGNIQRIRKGKKLSLERTAALAGVSRSMLGQIERGEANPSVAILGKIAQALKVPAEKLLENDDFESLLLARTAAVKAQLSDAGTVNLRPSLPYDEATRQELIARDRERLKQMTFYCTTTECLRHYILRYFGENSPMSCGHCSSCDTNFEEVDATMDARKILSCVYRLDERGRAFGKTVVSAILTGSKNEKITQFGLDTLSTYNIMPDSTAVYVRRLIDMLLERGGGLADVQHLLR